VRALRALGYTYGEHFVTGRLISYNADLVDIWRRAAVYVDKIVKGRQRRRPAHRAAQQVRACHQTQERESARTHNPGIAVVTRE